MFGPLGFWTMAPLRYAAKFDPFLSLDCARVEGVLLPAGPLTLVFWTIGPRSTFLSLAPAPVASCKLKLTSAMLPPTYMDQCGTCTSYPLVAIVLGES